MNLASDTIAILQHAAEAACRAGLRAGLAETDARDLAQEALVRALTSARPPAGVALPAWVYGIARNLGRDHAKSAKRREVALDRAADAAIEVDLTTVLAVRRAVEELPPPLRDVVTLHELEDNSLRETADALQIPFDTAKDRLRRAREQLRARLDDNDVASERAHTRRRAAAAGAAIVAAVTVLLGERSIAAAAVTGSVAAASTASRVVPVWIAAALGSSLLAGGFVAGRYTAPAEPAARGPVIEIASSSQVSEPDTERAFIAAVPSAVAPSEPPAPRSAVARDAQRAAASPPSAPPVPPPTLAPDKAEHLLIDRARTGLRRGMQDEALVTLMTHAREHPSGTLAEERDVLIIEAYLRSGKHAIAQRRIDRYASDHPRGVLRARVDALAAELRP